jgi:hypothetical protein
MPDNDQQDTEAAPTTEASAETTELPPASHAEQAYAWSIDDTTELDSEPRRGRWLSAGLVTLVAVIAGALIYLAATFFGFGESKHVEPSATPSTSVPIAPPPTSATVTVTAAPPPPALDFCADLNRQLPPPAVANAGEVCRNTVPIVQDLCIKLHQGATVQELMDYRLGETSEKTQSVYIALAVKHFCPEFTNKL